MKLIFDQRCVVGVGRHPHQSAYPDVGRASGNRLYSSSRHSSGLEPCLAFFIARYVPPTGHGDTIMFSRLLVDFLQKF